MVLMVSPEAVTVSLLPYRKIEPPEPVTVAVEFGYS
jgi:hypothetical protein